LRRSIGRLGRGGVCRARKHFLPGARRANGGSRRADGNASGCAVRRTGPTGLTGNDGGSDWGRTGRVPGTAVKTHNSGGVAGPNHVTGNETQTGRRTGGDDRRGSETRNGGPGSRGDSAGDSG